MPNRKRRAWAMGRHAIPGPGRPVPRSGAIGPGGTLSPRRIALRRPRIVRPLYLRLTLIVASAGLGLAVVGIALVPAALGLARADTATPTAMSLGPLDQRSYVYASDGTVLAALRAEVDRQPVPLADIPEEMVDAVLSVEDSQFFIHSGVNLRATLRALVHNVDAGQTVQGGSTITQQIVKNDLVGNQRTVGRKAREAILAARLEQQMTKDQLLERYLNTVYFGNGAYGVQAAARDLLRGRGQGARRRRLGLPGRDDRQPERLRPDPPPGSRPGPPGRGAQADGRGAQHHPGPSRRDLPSARCPSRSRACSPRPTRTSWRRSSSSC